MPVVVDTSAVPAADRFEFWATTLSRGWYPLAVKQHEPDPFAARAATYFLPPFTMCRITGDASSILRTPAKIRERDPEEVTFALHLRGHSRVVQGDRVTTVEPGEITSYESSHPYAFHSEPRFDLIAFSAPRVAFGAYADAVCSKTACRIPADNGVALVVQPFLRHLADALERGAMQEHDPNMGEGLLALFRGLYAPSGSPTAGVRAQTHEELRVRIRAFITANLASPDLTPETIARRHHISRRHLYKLFEDEPRSVSHCIRQKRLEAAARDLRDPLLAPEAISEIARRWGFRRVEPFSRLFRDTYGCSPREFRRRSRAS